MMVWVKICGITNTNDAAAAISYGADALGFVFAPSKRKIAPDAARKIIKDLPAKVEKIGVFANEDAKVVSEIADYCGLTGIQLHGEESVEYCSYLNGYDVIKVFRVTSIIDSQKIKAYIDNHSINRVLLDTYIPDQIGGTGKTFAWEIAACQRLPQIPVIIAGGLNPDNVVFAIRIGCPFGVDVSSGVEKEPGIKELEKLRKFIERAKKPIS